MTKLLVKTPSGDAQHQHTSKREVYCEFLRHIPLFNEFSEQALSEVLANTRVKKYRKGETLFMTGDSAEYFRIIIQGWVKLYRETRDGHEVIVSVLSNNDVFGKTAILGKSKYLYTAEAITDAEILMISAAFMLRIIEHGNEYDHFLTKFLDAELNETQQLGLHAEHLAQMTSAERVGCFLLRLCGAQREGSITLHLPYEKALAAGRLGMTAETFSRSLSQLAALGVETRNSEVTIHSIAQLTSKICEHCSATRLECPMGEEIDAT